MPYSWTNRKGVSYVLCEIETKRGLRYVFARDPRGRPLEELPEGFEVHESVGGIVSVRKARPSRLNPLEVELVRRRIAGRGDLRGYRIDTADDCITIYGPSQEISYLQSLGLPMDVVEDVVERSPLLPLLRFTLVDPEDRTFAAERWCFRGAIDGWIPVGSLSRIVDLASELLPHLAHQSFYELH